MTSNLGVRKSEVKIITAFFRNLCIMRMATFATHIRNRLGTSLESFKGPAGRIQAFRRDQVPEKTSHNQAASEKSYHPSH